MKKYIGHSWRLIFSNWETLFLFQIIYTVFYFLLQFAIRVCLSLSLESNQLTYLTNENLSGMLLNPVSMVLLAVALLIFGLYLYNGCIVLYTYIELATGGDKVTLRRLIKASFLKARTHTLSFHAPLFIYLLLFVPLLGIAFHTPYLKGIQIPEFIMAFIHQKMSLRILLYIFYIILMLVFVFMLFVPFEMILNNRTWRAACRQSFFVVRKNFCSTLFSVIAWNLFVMLFCYLIYIGLILLLVFYTKVIHYDIQFFWFYFKRIEAVFRLIKPVLYVCGNMVLVLVLYQKYAGKYISEPSKTSHRRLPKRVLTILGILAVLILSIEFIDYSVYEQFDASGIDIVSHRAGGVLAPENTISGLLEAIKSGSSYAEIDVQLTADGVLVLSHDTSLERIANVNVKISDITYEQLCQYDAGAYFGMQYSGEKFPTLAEVLDEADGKIQLMIELKSGEKDVDLVNKTLELVYEKRMEDQCVIASLNIDILKRVRSMNSSVKTAYIVALAYGDLTSVEPEIDIFAVEPTYVSRAILNELRAADKKVFVWTVNKENNLAKAVELPIDGIITDNPYLAQYVMETRGLDPLILEILKWL